MWKQMLRKYSLEMFICYYFPSYIVIARYHAQWENRCCINTAWICVYVTIFLVILLLVPLPFNVLEKPALCCQIWGQQSSSCFPTLSLLFSKCETLYLFTVWVSMLIWIYILKNFINKWSLNLQGLNYICHLNGRIVAKVEKIKKKKRRPES